MTTIPEGFAQVVVTWLPNGGTRPQEVALGLFNGDPNPDYPTALEFFTQASQTGNWLTSSGYDSSYTLTRVRMTAMTDTGPVSTEHNPNQAGSTALTAVPPNLAGLIRKRTARGGRQGRGRMYVPAGYLDDQDVSETGTISGNSLVRLNSFVTRLQTTLTALTLSPVLLHDSEALTPDLITSFEPQSLAATMRRRLRK